MKSTNKLLVTMLLIGLASIFSSCASIPKNAKPVQYFDANRYLGIWYEIARFDFRFERNMDNTTAQYSLNKNGNITVLNSGFNYVENKWKKAEGVAKFRDSKKVGALEVSFFGPFYSAYNVIALDNDYQYALVAGKDLDYLWILSREKKIPDDVKADYLEIAKNIGYDTSRLIWVKHDKNDNPYLEKK